jgi:hypothetical protein
VAPTKKKPTAADDPFVGVVNRAGVLAMHHYLIGPVLMLLLASPGFGVYLIVRQCSENLPRAGRDQAPRELSCREVVEGEVEENDYVVVTKFRVLSDKLVFDEFGFLKASDGKTRFEVAPLEALPGRPEESLVVESDKVLTPLRLAELQAGNRLEGTVVRDAGPERRAAGGTEPVPRRWLLQHGARPPTLLGTWLLIGGGVVLILVGLPVWLLVGWGLVIGIKEFFGGTKATGRPTEDLSRN